MCLAGVFINSDDLDVSVYNSNLSSSRPPGEVWCVGGRNLQPIFFQRIQDNPGSSSLLTAHFGELATCQHQLCQIPNIKLIILTIKHERTRRSLDHRHQRLGQTIHPYWLDEELVRCYEIPMYERYFGIVADHCIEIDIYDFWNYDRFDTVLERIEQFLSIQIPREPAESLHLKWIDLNWPQG